MSPMRTLYIGAPSQCGRLAERQSFNLKGVSPVHEICKVHWDTEEDHLIYCWIQRFLG